MGAIASQTTSRSIVYSTVNSDADQRKHQSSASLAFVWGIHRGPVNSPHKGPVTRKMFPFDDVIMRLKNTPLILQYRVMVILLKNIISHWVPMRWLRYSPIKSSANRWENCNYDVYLTLAIHHPFQPSIYSEVGLKDDHWAKESSSTSIIQSNANYYFVEWVNSCVNLPVTFLHTTC